MVVFSPVAQQPSSGIEDRLQAIQEILRRSDQQTVGSPYRSSNTTTPIIHGDSVYSFDKIC